MRIHFSQEGEDVLLERIFFDQGFGRYVDVGAHHPFRFSNTYWAYLRGWSGINIDATPGFETKFQRWRSRDVNVNAFISSSEGKVAFTTYPDRALNTGVAQRVSTLSAVEGIVGSVVEVQSLRLETVLRKFLPDGAQLDLLSIDVEGNELEVLKSNDWNRFAPRVVVVEVLGFTLDTVTESQAVRSLIGLGYVPVSMLYHSVILIRDPELLKKHWR